MAAWQKEEQALISLDGKQFGRVMGSVLTEQFRLADKSNAFIYLAKGSGGGRLTKAAILAVAGMTKKAIDNPKAAGIGEASEAWKKNTDKWEELKQKYGGNIGIGGGSVAGHWKFLGNIQKNIGVSYFTKHSMAVGIKKGVLVKQNVFGNKNEMIEVRKKAKFLEYGTSKLSAKPLFRPVMQVFLNNYWPGYLDIFSTVMKRANTQRNRANASRAARKVENSVEGTDGVKIANAIIKKGEAVMGPVFKNLTAMKSDSISESGEFFEVGESATNAAIWGSKNLAKNELLKTHKKLKGKISDEEYQAGIKFINGMTVAELKVTKENEPI